MLYWFISLNSEKRLYIQYISVFKFILTLLFYIYYCFNVSEKENYSTKKIFNIYKV